MKLHDYLMDKWLYLFIALFGYWIIIMMLFAFKLPSSLVVAISIVNLFTFLILFEVDYFKKRRFYQQLIHLVDQLDKKYLVLEMLSTPSFYEGQIFYQALYEINKSMMENIKKYELQMTDFKEYIEMWIHEVKIPVSSLILMCHNHKGEINKKYVEQIRRVDRYLDQVLYYVRSENAEKDYMIRDTDLSNVVHQVALKNQDDLLEHQIDFTVEVKDTNVLTDAKWLEFILNQIINNSIKYQREKIDSCIRITAKEVGSQVYLTVYDNGIGIPKKDIGRVFNKSFTGENGRGAKSTGMGLYIVKKLCDKLGHKIEIESVVSEYTKVTIIFGTSDYYKMKI